MTTPTAIDTGIARHLGTYADAVRIPAGLDLIALSGTPGLRPDGSRPEDFAEEARQAWRNVVAALASAGAAPGDIVSARTWLIDADDLPTYLRVRKEFIGHQPTYMLAVVPQMVRADLRVEIEILAAIRPSA